MVSNQQNQSKIVDKIQIIANGTVWSFDSVFGKYLNGNVKEIFLEEPSVYSLQLSVDQFGAILWKPLHTASKFLNFGFRKNNTPLEFFLGQMCFELDEIL